MFLHIGNFTKQMKAAYKNGRLDIGNVDGGLFLCSGHWVVWIEEHYVPNKIKAMVMELAGVMPERGHLFEISKNKPDPQTKIWAATYRELLEYKAVVDDKLIITPLELFEHGLITLLQNLRGDVFGVNTEYYGMVDKEAIDFDVGESTPTGPCYGRDINKGIYWYSDFGTVIIMPKLLGDKNIALVEALQHIQFKEDGSVERKYRRIFYDETTLDDDRCGVENSSECASGGEPEADSVEESQDDEPDTFYSDEDETNTEGQAG